MRDIKYYAGAKLRSRKNSSEPEAAQSPTLRIADFKMAGKMERRMLDTRCWILVARAY